MVHYEAIAAELDRVRQAWRRTAVLSGLAVVLVEAAGLLALAYLIDLLFHPAPAGRLVLLAIGIGVLAVLLVRQVVRPLREPLPDARIALYVEEHNPGFEGALVAAAEFGSGTEGDAEQREIVRSILAEAESRARRFDLRRAVDLSRLRKYGALAAVVVTVYGLLGVLFPADLGRHAVRLLTPWVPEPVAEGVAPEAAPGPITFELSAGDTDLLRGAAFRLEAQLSREPRTPVTFHFRSVGGSPEETPWSLLPMQEIEKLHGYALELSDVNEEMQYFVAAESDRSPTYRLTVYDPLVVEGLRITVRYPEYLRLPDRSVTSPGGEFGAPVGSTATLRVLTNRPLASASLEWDDGSTLALAIDPAEPNAALATVPVDVSRSYRYRVTDVRDQVAVSPAPARIEALADKPPAIALEAPGAEIAPTPVDEITFRGTATDDWALESAVLVYRRGGAADAPEHRVPMALAGGGGALTSVPVSALLELEALTPRPTVREVFSYYLEASDRKGQQAVSTVGFFAIYPVESWAVESWGVPHGAEEAPDRISLPDLYRLAWTLQNEKPRIPPQDYARRLKGLAGEMIDPETGTVWVYAEPEHGRTYSDEEFAKMDRVNELAREAHSAFAGEDGPAGTERLRQAVVLMIELGLVEDLEQLLALTDAVVPAGDEDRTAFEEQMAELARLDRDTPEIRPEDEGIRREVEAAEERRLQGREMEEVEAAQADVAAEARELAKREEAGEPADQDRRELARDQQRVADQARRAAEQLRTAAEANDENLEAAADAVMEAVQKMQEAAAGMTEGRMEQASRDADVALRQLTRVREQLVGLSQDQLAAALNEAERRAQRLLGEQERAAGRVETLAAAMGEGTDRPGEAQQRDAKVAAAEQARLRGDLENLEAAVTALGKAGESGAIRRDTAAFVSDAAREIRRGRIDRRMTNATVELTAFRADRAVAEQRQAVASLGRVLDGIRAASDSVASDYGSELRRARGEAERTDGLIARLSPAAAATVEREVGSAPRPVSSEPVARGEREALASEAALTLAQLQRHVESREFVAEETRRRLSEHTRNPAGLAAALDTDETASRAVLATVRQTHIELEEAYRAHVEAKRLFSSQREDCPPQYRHLVNRYFEALSGASEP